MGGRQAFRPPKPVQRPAQVQPPQQRSSEQQQSVAQTQRQTQTQGQAQHSALSLKQSQTQSNLSAQNSHQSQNQDLAIVNRQQSLQVIKTTLEASLGTICYLRNILPDDNFANTFIAPSSPPGGLTPDELYHLSSDEAKAMHERLLAQQEHTQSQSQQASGSQSGKHSTRPFSWRRICHSRTAPADRILKLLEGVMDGVARGYIHSMAFFIFLDMNNPSEIIETYTFNFFYNDQTGIPEVTIKRSISAGGSSQSQSSSSRNQVPEWKSKKDVLGEAMTSLDVRRAVKHYTTELIKLCQEMEDLPNQRYADLKVYYTQTAPPDYEAPGFSDTIEVLTMSTKQVDDPPAKLPMEHLQTGHHGLALTVLSVADLLPITTKSKDNESDQERMARLASHQAALAVSADERRVVWNSDILAHDRITFERGSGDIYTKLDPDRAVAESSIGGLKQPIGERQDNGHIRAIPAKRAPGKTTERNRGKKLRVEGERRIDEDSIQLSQTMPMDSIHDTLASVSEVHQDLSSSESSRQTASTSRLDSNPVSLGLDPVIETQLSSQEGPGMRYRTQTPLFILASTPNSSESRSHDNRPDVEGNSLMETLPVTKKRTRPLLFDTEETQPTSRISNVRSAAKPKKAPAKKISSTTQKPKKQQTKAKPKPKPKPKPMNPKPKTSTSALTATKNAPKVKLRKTSSPTKRNAKSSDNNEAVECYCHSSDEMEEIIQCEGCNRWIHGICAGFIDLKTATKQRFLCLGCEMGSDDRRRWVAADVQRAYDEMYQLSLMRRVMNHIRKIGEFTNVDQVELRRELGCPAPDLNHIIQAIEAAGFFGPISSLQQGRAHASSTRYWTQNPELTDLYIAYFRPRAGIEDEIIEYRKICAQDTTTASSNSLDNPNSERASQNGISQAGSRSSTNRRDIETSLLNSYADAEIDSAHGNPSHSSRVTNVNGNGSSSTGATTYEIPRSDYDLPPIRSGRANACLDVTKTWS